MNRNELLVSALIFGLVTAGLAVLGLRVFPPPTKIYREACVFLPDAEGQFLSDPLVMTCCGPEAYCTVAEDPPTDDPAEQCAMACSIEFHCDCIESVSEGCEGARKTVRDHNCKCPSPTATMLQSCSPSSRLRDS